jgi:Transposase DDE domain
MNFKVLYQWKEEIASHLGTLNSWQVENVALFSYGVVKAESCQQGQIARQVSCGEQVESSMRRWRRFLDNEGFPLESFFQQWTSWVVEALGEKRITLLVDETKLHDRIGVMMVGVAWQGRCIPLVWRVYRANDALSYPAEGQVRMIGRLLQTIQAGLPVETQVLVLADRGIGTSPELCKQVAALGWSYLFRVTCQTKIVTQQGDYSIAQQVQPGEIWAASGEIFKQRGRIPAYARALWGFGYDQAWGLVTNDDKLTGHEYGRRNWQEHSFRDLKSGGWHWGESRIDMPDHVERLLVVLVLAYAYILALGSQAVALDLGHSLQRHADGRLSRHFSLFKEGLNYFIDRIQRFSGCPLLCFIPDCRFT